MLAAGRRVSVVGVALLAAERCLRPVAFIGGRDVDVALAQPLAGAQTQARLPQHGRVIL